MSYENAPATKLLATACACCGRPLVDAVSVETGVGPDCRARFFVAAEGSEENRAEANALVFRVAKKDVDRAEMIEVCEALRALGFVVLADRILARFRLSFARLAEIAAAEEAARAAEAAKATADVAKLRGEYAAIRDAFLYDAVANAEEFRRLVVEEAGEDASPARFVEVAKALEVSCPACRGSGEYHGQHELGPCFRCGGKGTQNLDDARRNRAYDATNRSRRNRAA